MEVIKQNFIDFPLHNTTIAISLLFFLDTMKYIYGVVVCMVLWLSYVVQGWVYADQADQQVVSWLYGQWLTKYAHLDDFRPAWNISRGEAAKFMVEYARSINHQKIRQASVCQFSDIAGYDYTLETYIVESCEYWIFQWSQGKFFPTQPITQWEAIAVVMRMAYGLGDESEYPWYQEYIHQAINLAIRRVRYVWNWQSYEQPITRIHIAQWLYDLYHIQRTGLGIWQWPHKVYNLHSADHVLNGNGASCETVLATSYEYITYECNESETYPDILEFLWALRRGEYQTAADLMNTTSMIPRFFSSLNEPIHFVPFNTGILGVFLMGNDIEYRLFYITIALDKLHIYFYGEVLEEWMSDQHLKDVLLGRVSDPKMMEIIQTFQDQILRAQQ
jgi:hypothetical protein